MGRKIQTQPPRAWRFCGKTCRINSVYYEYQKVKKVASRRFISLILFRIRPTTERQTISHRGGTGSMLRTKSFPAGRVCVKTAVLELVRRSMSAEAIKK